jgi:hypothetical protein
MIMMRSFINRRVAIALVALPLLLATGVSTLSQRNNNPNPAKEPPLRELLQLPGRLISENKAARPSSDLRLTGYRVEEVRLPRNLTVEVRGQNVVVDKAWRVTVQGGPFQVTAITFDSSLIREGGVVSVSYGEDKETRRKLPQGLQVKRGGENQ